VNKAIVIIYAVLFIFSKNIFLVFQLSQ